MFMLSKNWFWKFHCSINSICICVIENANIVAHQIGSMHWWSERGPNQVEVKFHKVDHCRRLYVSLLPFPVSLRLCYLFTFALFSYTVITRSSQWNSLAFTLCFELCCFWHGRIRIVRIRINSLSLRAKSKCIMLPCSIWLDGFLRKYFRELLFQLWSSVN